MSGGVNYIGTLKGGDIEGRLDPKRVKIRRSESSIPQLFSEPLASDGVP
jgi:hypothetical protein